MCADFNEYADLGATGYKSTEPTKPEDEFFHSLYISGQKRTNHVNIVEMPGQLQIRGVEYNLMKAHMIITHVKKVLVKQEKGPKGDQVVACFSFKKDPNPPWFGWNNRPCGSNSAERAAIPFCSTCREQIILAGIYCDEMGNPILHAETNKPLFVFLRGKGMKYNNVSQYLADCYNEEITSPLFQPSTAESLEFEKVAVNNKRHVTVIEMDTAPSAFGDKDVFVFSKGAALSNENIMSILKLAKSSLDKFNEKFDWSRTDTTTGYTPDGTPSVNTSVNESNVIPESNPTPKQQNNVNKEKVEPVKQPTFNFEDIKF